MSDLEQDLEQGLDPATDRARDSVAEPVSDPDDAAYDDRDDAAYDALEDSASVSLFEGDEGTLEFTRRRTLVTLLKSRFISARTHPREWEVLVEDEQLLRSRLNDLFLDLLVDREREVAWKRQASSETGGRFPTLLHDVPWSREETLVLVHLRDRLRAGYASGEARVFIDREDIVEHVASFRPLHATDESGDEKRARNAVLSIVKSGLLIGAAGDDRYEISEAVEPLLPLELLTELLDALRRANSVEERPARVEDLFGDAATEGDDRDDAGIDDEEDWA
ncbi:DUF4194 domain-containing protein [Nocardioides daphniae]|uniref:DUF4194 domain-containing protein n=1 Tax=Nocardioides daphniae TaxID=402297 RepID=A0A4P7UDE2_9ACTN|nr:DUF4194 domain-containing protein [Nocardioides daphniae]QCC77561.1 DUF4194 domain-containing protein [Nocardioides daphniae]GGD30769.1 hypothetical protein GCM10007231_32820 [Nocardioides daphniae]